MIHRRLIFGFSLEDSKQFICLSIIFQSSKNCLIWWRRDHKWYREMKTYRNGMVNKTFGTTSTMFCTLQLFMINWIDWKIPNTSQSSRMIKVNSHRKISEVERCWTEISSRLGWIPLYFRHCHNEWWVLSKDNRSVAAGLTMILGILCIINWKPTRSRNWLRS